MPDNAAEAAAVEGLLLEFDLAELRAATVETALRDELDALRTELEIVRMERDLALARQHPPASQLGERPAPVGQAMGVVGRVVHRLRSSLRRAPVRLSEATRRFERSSDRRSAKR